MVYTYERPPLGIVITITTHRKCGNGAKGGGRKGSSGKKAVVLANGSDPITITEATISELLKEVRKRFSIPPHVRINKEGETRI